MSSVSVSAVASNACSKRMGEAGIGAAGSLAAARSM